MLRRSRSANGSGQGSVGRWSLLGVWLSGFGVVVVVVVVGVELGVQLVAGSQLVSVGRSGRRVGQAPHRNLGGRWRR